MASRSLIQVDRGLVRSAITIMLRHERWQQSACRNAVNLVRCLNGIQHRHPYERYNLGFPQPAEGLRLLTRIRNLAQKAAATGKSGQLEQRLEAFIQEDQDVIHLLRFQIALALDPVNPSRRVLDIDTRHELLERAKRDPQSLITFCDKVTEGLKREKKTGKGGARRQVEQDRRYIIEELGLFFEQATGEVPGASFVDSERTRDSYGGIFIELCELVLDAFGLEMSRNKIYRALRSIDNDRWKEARADRGFGKRAPEQNPKNH